MPTSASPESTLERRLHHCNEELRLNRRLAPDLYLDVVPIAQVDGRVRVGDSSGAAIEYAVRMKQFDREQELPALQPVLILMHGPAGSGKSWLSEQLIEALPALRVRSDLERKRLAGLSTATSAANAPNAGIYVPEMSHRTYARRGAASRNYGRYA